MSPGGQNQREKGWDGGTEVNYSGLGVRVLVHIVELFKDFEQGVGDINLVTPVQVRGYTSVPYSGPWMPFCYGESVFVLSPLGRTCHAI